MQADALCRSLFYSKIAALCRCIAIDLSFHFITFQQPPDTLADWIETGMSARLW